MASIKRLSATTLTALVAASTAISPLLAAPHPPSPLVRMSLDVEIARLLARLQQRAPFGFVEVYNVQIVDPLKGTVTPESAILVQGARIVDVMKAADVPNVPGVTKIDGHGRFAMPGLTDMHIHSTRADGWLLNIANGVTTVRDMDGFPWMLRARDQINAGKMLGPTDYVAGTIIAAAPLEGYAIVTANPADARRVVRQQAACGYDFIKVHNVLPQPQLDAVAAQAHLLGMDLVGHIPHDISIDHALHVDRMRTTEHLKGFINDHNFHPSDEDFGTVLANTQTWITPTLYTSIGYERGDWAKAFLRGPLVAYAPPDVRAQWAKLVTHPSERDLRLGPDLKKAQDNVMKRLVPLHPHWLTGTDAENYPFNLMGFGLVDEMRLMQSAGVSSLELIRASTAEAAAAMHQDEEFGRIAKGFRADFILVDSNPLTDVVTAVARNQGVMVHGHWLDRASLDRALADLALIYSDGHSTPEMTAANTQSLITHIGMAQADGFVFDDQALAELVLALVKAHQYALAKAVQALEVGQPWRPCYVPPPTD